MTVIPKPVLSPTLSDLQLQVGAPARASQWLTVVQADINDFARVTHDLDPNHIDEGYARVHSPTRTTVAFGFQTLSYLTFLLKSAGLFPCDAVEVVNYGFDRVRFVSYVCVGSRIRGLFRVISADEKAPTGRILIRYGVEVEIEGQSKPAMAAVWLALYGKPLGPAELT